MLIKLAAHSCQRSHPPHPSKTGPVLGPDIERGPVHGDGVSRVSAVIGARAVLCTQQSHNLMVGEKGTGP